MCFIYLSEFVRFTVLGRNIYLLIVFYLFNEFNKFRLCVRYCFREVNLEKEIVKVKRFVFMKFLFLREEIDKEEGD